MAKSESDKAMGQLVQLLRARLPRRPTQSELAQLAGMSTSKVALVESGNRSMREQDVAVWAGVLEVTPEALLRLHRAINGYLTLGTKEVWWQEPASPEELLRFDSNSYEHESEEDRDRFQEYLADQWHEFVRMRFGEYVRDLVSAMLNDNDVLVDLVELAQESFPLMGVLALQITGMSQFPNSTHSPIVIEPPATPPLRQAEFLHHSFPEQADALDRLREVMTPQEVRQVTAYALGLVHGRLGQST